MSEISQFLQNTLRQAGALLLSQNVIVNKHKTINDLLTQNDINIENFIVGEINKFDEGSSVISEENYSDGALTGRCFVVDPIDGTCNFAAGLTLFGIQTAYFENGKILLSVIYYPSTGDMLVAEKGKGAYLNGNRIAVKGSQSAHDGILLISDYYSDTAVPIDKQFGLVKSLQSEFLKTRHIGAACVDFGLLARGVAAAYVCHYSKIWDIAPGLLAAEEAGCVYCDLNGSPYEFSGNTGLVVANNRDNLQLIIQKFSKLG